MRVAHHNKALSNTIRVFGISVVEAWFIAMVWSIGSYFLPGWFSLIGLLAGYFICVAGDSVQPKMIESLLIYAVRPHLIRKK